MIIITFKTFLGTAAKNSSILYLCIATTLPTVVLLCCHSAIYNLTGFKSQTERDAILYMIKRQTCDVTILA